MFRHDEDESTGESSVSAKNVQAVIDFWNALSCMDEEPAGISREELDKLQRQVAECFAKVPYEHVTAFSITAKAALLLNGKNYV